MALQYKSTVSISALVAVLFGVYIAVAAELTLQITHLLKLQLTFIPPTVQLSLAFVHQLIVQYGIALGFSLPNFNANFAIALQFELGIVLGLIAALEGIASASLLAYAYVGDAQDFGTTLNGAISGGWPDGTSALQNVTAYLFVATASGPHTSDQIASASLIPPAAPAPTPTNPAPPAGAYPPPPSYEWGLASISFPSQLTPSVVYPANPATGTLTLDNSVATGIGKVTAITMTSNGSGYPGPAFALISDTVNIVSATVASPVVVTLPNALSIPVGNGFGVTVAGVVGSTVISAATNASPIVVTVPSTANLQTCTIAGALGNTGANGQWYCQVLSPTTAALYADAAFTVPSAGTGAYTGGGVLTGNINGLQFAKVLLGGTTVALYQDQAMSIPVVGYGTYTGGTVTGGGTGQSARVTMGGGSQTGLKGFFVGLQWPTVGPAIKGGAITISAMCAGAFDLIVALLAWLNQRKGVLLAATLQASLRVLPPTINAGISLLGKIAVNLSANLKIKPPAFGVALAAQIGIIANLVARITAQLGYGDVQLEIWEYTGPGANFGQAISQGPGSSGWHDGTSTSSVVAAAVIGLTDAVAVDAFGAFFVGV